MHPDQPMPPHCPQRWEVQPEAVVVVVVLAEDVFVLVEEVVLVLLVVALLVVVVVVEPPVMPNHSISAAPLMGMSWVMPAP